MPPERSSVPLSTFVIRFWRETRGGRVRWRGRVQHIQTGEYAAFADEAGLLDFVRRWVQMPGRDEEEQTPD